MTIMAATGFYNLWPLCIFMLWFDDTLVVLVISADHVGYKAFKTIGVR